MALGLYQAENNIVYPIRSTVAPTGTFASFHLAVRPLPTKTLFRTY